MALAALGRAPSAAASPQGVVGFGFRSLGMGNTGAAVGEGVDSVYANPALLSASHDLSLEVGVLGASFHYDVEGDALGAPLVLPVAVGQHHRRLLPLPFGGAERPGQHRSRVPHALRRVVRGRIPIGQAQPACGPGPVGGGQAAMGLDLGYGIRLGGGFAALAALSGSWSWPPMPGRIGTVVGGHPVASFAPLVGASYDLGEAYRVGLSFRGELEGRFNVVISAENQDKSRSALNISGVAQYDPGRSPRRWRVAGAGAWRWGSPTALARLPGAVEPPCAAGRTDRSHLRAARAPDPVTTRCWRSPGSSAPSS